MVKKSGRLVGEMPCEICNRRVEVRVCTTGPHNLYYNCAGDIEPCRQMFSRGKKLISSKLLAKKITKWRDAEARAFYLGIETKPAVEADIEKTKAAVSPAGPPAAKKKPSWLDAPL